MLHCARECNTRVAENHITFGEFCVFATELRRYYATNERDPTAVLSLPNQISRVPEKRKKGELRTQRSTTSSYDTFLGGSCNPTTWRQDTAIPHLKAKDITFYNPQQANWSPEMIELEHQAKVTSQILFYVLNEQTRNVASMIEVSQYAGSNRRLIVVLNPYPGPEHTVNGEQLTKVSTWPTQRESEALHRTCAENINTAAVTPGSRWCQEIHPRHICTFPTSGRFIRRAGINIKACMSCKLIPSHVERNAWVKSSRPH